MSVSQVLEHLRRHDNRSAVARAAVDDAVADGKHSGVSILGAEPCRERVESRAGIGDRAVQPIFGDSVALTVFRGESRRRADAVDLAPRLELPLVFCRAVDTKLEARRAGVEDERVFAHN